MRTTSNIYGPHANPGDISVPVGEPVDSCNNAVACILSGIGFSSLDITQSKVGRLATILIQDTLDFLGREFPELPQSALIDIAIKRITEAELKELLDKLVERTFDTQQRIYKDVASGKADDWLNGQQQPAVDEASDTQESETEEPVDATATVTDEEPVECEEEATVATSDEEPVEAEETED